MDNIKIIRNELLEHAGEDTIATSYDNLGVQITKKSMDFVDIESGTSLLRFVRQESQILPDYADIALTKKYLEAYLITNEDVLDAEVVEELKRLIALYKSKMSR